MERLKKERSASLYDDSRTLLVLTTNVMFDSGQFVLAHFLR